MSSLFDPEIEEIDFKALTETQIVAINEFENIVHEESFPDDPPTPLERTRAQVLNIPPSIVFREFWARDDNGRIMAQGYGWWRGDENRHVLQVSINVRPSHRQKRLGTRLLERLAAVARDEQRPTLTWATSDRVSAGEAFSRRLDADNALEVHTNRLLISDLDRELVRLWVDEGPGRAPGYSLVFVDGPYADEIVDDVVAIYNVMNDAPRGDLDLEDRTWTVEEMREQERQGVAQGTTRWVLFARHDATGRFVGFTEVFWHPDNPKVVQQGNTGVRTEHRGHALGKWLKADMLVRVLETWPDVGQVRTGNADSNAAMLGINHALGFKPFIAHVNWQTTLDRVEAYLAGVSV